MPLICPVCERDVEPGENRACPICDTDLSALVSYQEKKAITPAPAKKRWWWLLLLLLLIPMIWFFFLREEPEPQVALVTVVVTATEQPVEESAEAALPTATLQPPTETPTEALTSTTTPMSAPIEPPEALAEVDVNCRCGPGMDFSVVGYFPEGSAADVQAALTDGSWLMITHPQRDDLACWIWSGAVTVSGDLSAVPGLSPTK